MKTHEQFQAVQLDVPDDTFLTDEDEALTPPCDLADTMLKGARAHMVQAIRAYRAEDLQQTAARLGQHFLYADLNATQSKQEVLEAIARQFMLPGHFGRNFDALYDCITDPIDKSGPQTGFIVVVENIPLASRFDREAREILLDCFRDAADYWVAKGVPFRCFYSFQ